MNTVLFIVCFALRHHRYCSFVYTRSISLDHKPSRTFLSLNDHFTSGSSSIKNLDVLRKKYFIPLTRARNGGLPRSTFASTSDLALNQRLYIFLKGFLLEVFCVVISLSLIQLLPKIKELFVQVSYRNFVSINITRWIISSLAVRLVLLQSNITSSRPSTLRGEDADWFLVGSYFAMSDETDSPIPVHIRQVPGNGSCLFLAIAASILYNNSSTKDNTKHHPSMSDVHKLSLELRSRAVDFLSNGVRRKTQLIIQNDEDIDAATLVGAAAEQYGITVDEYLHNMRDVKVWGGGPEVVSLANELKCPIILLKTIDDNAVKSPDDSFNKTAINVRVSSRFGPKLRTNKANTPIYILSANQNFPRKYRSNAKDNHFLAVFPTSHL